MKYNKFYDAGAPGSDKGGAYGYAEDEVKQSPFVFGLNAGVTFLKKFEWIPNGGKQGAEQEALDIVFEINGTEKSYRKFPVVKAFKKDTQEEVTDPNAPEFREAVQDLNAVLTHILHAYLDSDSVKAGLNRPIRSFKEFCQVAQSLLPTDYATRPLDIFMQFQWQLGEGKDRTYLEIPSKMKYGKWLVAAQKGKWTEHREPNFTEATRKALWYTNEDGLEHPFTKNGWFMASAFANQQRPGGSSAPSNAAMSAGATSAQAQTPQTQTAGQKSAW
jgi:hypothetical protein